MVTWLLPLFIVQSLGADPMPVLAVGWDGVEVINLRNPSLGYASNFRYEPNQKGNTTTMFFTADKSNPNLFTAAIRDVLNNIVLGAVLPSNFSTQNSVGTMLQAVFANGYNEGQYAVSAASSFPGYGFFSVIFDRTSVTDFGQATFYATGWANDNVYNVNGLFVARGTVSGVNAVNGSVPPVLTLMYDRQVSSIKMPFTCFDIYQEMKYPRMWIDNKSLYLAVTGRCSTITKTPLGAVDFRDTVWSTAINPIGEAQDKYLSAADLDPVNGLLYVSIQDYNRRDQTTIWAVDMRSYTMLNISQSLDTGGESQTLLVYSSEPADNTQLLFVLASGANKLYRYKIETNNKLTLSGIATIPDQVDSLSSAFYISPYLYWTTYARDASLARVHKKNFCLQTCPDHGYCKEGQCVCQEGWATVYNQSTISCVNQKIVEYQEKQQANKQTAVALGVCLVFSTVIGGVGWWMWKTIHV